MSYRWLRDRGKQEAIENSQRHAIVKTKKKKGWGSDGKDSKLAKFMAERLEGVLNCFTGNKQRDRQGVRSKKIGP